MPPCHTTPFLRPGLAIQTEPTKQEPVEAPHEDAGAEGCDFCGSARLEWRKCKLICADCRNINKSCADL